MNELECAVAVMDRIGGWEEGKEDENQIGAHFGACMWISTKAAISIRSKDMKNFISQIHPLTEAVNKTWDVLCGTHAWIQQDSMELQGSHTMKSLHYDTEVPCVMQWGLLWYSAPSHLNEILIKGGASQTCHDKTVRKATETSFTFPFEEWHMPRTTFLETQKKMMLQCVQGWAWRPERDMKGWYLGGRPDLFPEKEGDDPIKDNDFEEICDVSSCVCQSLRE